MQAAAERLGEKAVASGSGATFGSTALRWKPVSRLSPCAPCDTGLERAEIVAAGETVEISPIPEAAAPIVLSEDLKDLGASTARRVIEAIGGNLTLEGERLLVRLPA